MEFLDNLLVSLLSLFVLANFIVLWVGVSGGSQTIATRHAGIFLIGWASWFPVYFYFPDDGFFVFPDWYDEAFWYSGAISLVFYNLISALSSNKNVSEANFGEEKERGARSE